MLVSLLEDKRPLLSPRENRVLDSILSGKQHKETAYELGITYTAVKNYSWTIRRVIGFPKQQFRTWMKEQQEKATAA